MADFEYKVVAAPRKAKASKGVRSHEDQFANVLADVMNDLADDSWEYLRAESLPCEERAGITSRVEAYQSVLVFRRAIVADQKFFEATPSHQIEAHPVAEDVVESDILVDATRTTSLFDTHVEADEFVEADKTVGNGVLNILRHRRTRQQRENPENYAEHMKLAGE